MLLLAAVNVSRTGLVAFDGMGWVADLTLAKHFRSIPEAFEHIDREPPTHHPLELWEVRDGEVRLSIPDNRRRADLPKLFSIAIVPTGA